MTVAACLPTSFFARNTVAVARDLLGQRLVRLIDGGRLSGLISETEAYGGTEDEASHAHTLTARSAIMFGPPGRAYVYLIYGRNYCLNTVTEPEGQAGAVLIRGIRPEEGLAAMQAQRGPVPKHHLTDGPGKLCQALGIDLAFNGADLTTNGSLFIEESGREVTFAEIVPTPRVGVGGNLETRQRPWRFVWQPRSAPGGRA